MNITTYTATGTGAVALTCSPASGHSHFRVLNIEAHASGAVTEALTVTLDSKGGAAYDTLLSSDASWTNVYKVFDPNEIFENGDSIIVGCTEAGGTLTKSVTVRIELL